MNELWRRAARGLTVPLVVGASVVLLAGPAEAATPTVNVQADANPSLYGQEIHASRPCSTAR